jgi:hypothetical protein
MTPDSLRWPVVFTQNTAVYFEPTHEFGSAYLGGPLDQTFTGVSFGTAPLHRIFTFSPTGMPQPKGHNLQGRMSLFYGMRYPGCEMSYDVGVTQGVNAQYIKDFERTTAVSGFHPSRSDETWPYENYPALLPYARMKEVRRVSMEPEAFAESHIHQGLPTLTNTELCVVVPSISSFGVSMWGPAGDDAGQQVIFCYGYGTNEVRVSASAA